VATAGAITAGAGVLLGAGEGVGVTSITRLLLQALTRARPKIKAAPLTDRVSRQAGQIFSFGSMGGPFYGLRAITNTLQFYLPTLEFLEKKLRKG
jgi:hypothetical protein